MLAGTTVEGLRDGPALDGWLAQPSGLAVDGDRLWFVDSETSALRYLTLDGELHTAVGEGLFDFGHVDGPAAQAARSSTRSASPCSPTARSRCSTPTTARCAATTRPPTPSRTLARDLLEPSGAVLVDGDLVVVESAAHRLVRPGAALGAGQPARRSTPPVRSRRSRPAPVTLDVRFTPAPGRKLDERYGPSTRLTVTASPPELLRERRRRLDRADARRWSWPTAATGVLQVIAQAASCDEDGEHPACYLARQDWGVPIRITADGRQSSSSCSADRTGAGRHHRDASARSG